MIRAIRNMVSWRLLVVLSLVFGQVAFSATPVMAIPADIADRFDDRTYDGSDGSLGWATSWNESGDGDTGFESGDWSVAVDGLFEGHALRKTGQAGSSVVRVADLDGFTSADLSFSFRRQALASSKSIVVEISSAGPSGPWTPVTTIAGQVPQVTDLTYLPVSIPITEHISRTTAIRFTQPSGVGSFGAHMAVFIDDVRIHGDLGNRSPVLSTTGDFAVSEGSTLEFQVSASDPDGDDLSFSLDGEVPDGLAISADGLLTWATDETDGPGEYVFDVVVSDNASPARSDRETITVIVGELATPPTVESPSDQSSSEGDDVAVQLTAVDSDVPSGSLAWSASGLPQGLSIDPNGLISGQIGYDASASSPWAVEVSVWDDSGLEDSADFVWTVSDTNRPPVLDTVGDLVVMAGESLDLRLEATEPDGDDVIFTLDGSPPSDLTLTPGGRLRWSPTQSQVSATFVFDVVASDDSEPSLGDRETVSLSYVADDAPGASVDSEDQQPSGDTSNRDGDQESASPVDSPPVGSSSQPQPIPDPANPGADDNKETGSATIKTPEAQRPFSNVHAMVADATSPSWQQGVRSLAPAVLKSPGLSWSGLGIASLSTSSVAASPVTNGSSSLLTAVSLFTTAFFHSITAMDLPTLLLSFAGVALLGMRGVSKGHLVFGRRKSDFWSVVLLNREGRLRVRANPGTDGEEFYLLGPTTRGLAGTGEAVKHEGVTWVGITTPLGDGWVEREYLTEQVDAKTFMHDVRPQEMMDEFVDRLRAGKGVGKLIADRGLVLTLGELVQVIDSDEVSSLLRRPHDADSRLSGWNGKDFSRLVVSPLLEAYDSTPLISPHVAHAETALLAGPVRNFRYMALGGSEATPCLVFFEYEDGRPKIVGLTLED